MPDFVRAQEGGAEMLLDEAEAALVRQLTREMRMLLHSDAAEDPVTKRLFPDAYEDADDSLAFRQLVEDELRSGKLDALERVRSSLEGHGNVRVALDEGALSAWLTALTDMRLAIGTRLDVTEENALADVAADDPHAHAMAIYGWLGWVQESMLQSATEGQG